MPALLLDEPGTDDDAMTDRCVEDDATMFDTPVVVAGGVGNPEEVDDVEAIRESELLLGIELCEVE